MPTVRIGTNTDDTLVGTILDDIIVALGETIVPTEARATTRYSAALVAIRSSAVTAPIH